MPSSRRHSSRTAAAFCASTVKPGTRAAARSLSSQTASELRSRCAETSSSSAGNDIGGTTILTSPATLRGCRLVASSRSSGHALTRVTARTAQASSRCSQLSSTSSSRLPARYSASDDSDRPAERSCTPSALKTAWLVELASIHDPLLVTQAVFSALGVHDLSAGLSLSSLAEYLAGKRLLLVLDNCEHLLDACAVLAVTLAKACPELRLLATSRQPLRVAGEVRMVVPPMSLPAEEDEVSAQRLLSSDAVWLLSERAAALVPGFTVDAQNAAAVLELCRRLDGIPLALELAAVRLDSLSIDQLNRGLTGKLSILGRGDRGAETHQRTLEATISWSYGLLGEQERLLWARLSVFAGASKKTRPSVSAPARVSQPGGSWICSVRWWRSPSSRGSYATAGFPGTGSWKPSASTAGSACANSANRPPHSSGTSPGSAHLLVRPTPGTTSRPSGSRACPTNERTSGPRSTSAHGSQLSWQRVPVPPGA